MSRWLGKLLLLMASVWLSWIVLSAFGIVVPVSRPRIPFESPSTSAKADPFPAVSGNKSADLQRSSPGVAAVATSSVDPSSVTADSRVVLRDDRERVAVVRPDRTVSVASPSGNDADPAHLSPRSQRETSVRSGGNANAISPEHALHELFGPAWFLPPIRRRTVDPNAAIPADGHGRRLLDWDVLATTVIDNQFQPRFVASVKEIDGAPVSLSGYMTPFDDIGALDSFLLLEFPLGCFFCLTPDPTGMVLVELAAGTRESLQMHRVTITGRLRLNDSDPEDFLYIITDARLSPAE